MSHESPPGDSPSELLAVWLEALETAVAKGDESLVAELFTEDGQWRDVVSLSWDLRTVCGRTPVTRALLGAAPVSGFRQLRPAPGSPPPARVDRLDRQVVEGTFAFTTDAGEGLGMVRLAPPDGGAASRAWMMLTSLQQLAPASAKAPSDRRAGHLGFTPTHVNETWRDHRRARARWFEDHEPDVLVVGGGHSGLALAARLEHMGVNTLVVERLPTLGDTWRTRYDSLALHTLTAANQLPYLPYPSNFPRYLPKDKLGDWLEFYAAAMEINAWTSTELVGADHDEDTGRWRARVRRAGNREQVLRPRHLVLATGASQVPSIPSLDGLDDFAGEVTHVREFVSGAPYAGKRVLVVGVGTSGHDIALACHNHSAGVTMLQRNPTIVVSIEAVDKLYASYESGTPITHMDLLRELNFTGPFLKDSLRLSTTATAEEDRDLHEGLERAGMRLHQGSDGTGFRLMAHRTGGGYYIDVGASEKIVNGEIAVEQTRAMDRLVATGLQRKDGTVLPFDAVLLATGYLNMQEDVRALIGPEVADRVGPVFLYDDESMEFANAWRPTAQDGLWFMVGGFGQARTNSLYLALQIQARLRGLVPAGLPAPPA